MVRQGGLHHGPSSFTLAISKQLAVVVVCSNATFLDDKFNALLNLAMILFCQKRQIVEDKLDKATANGAWLLIAYDADRRFAMPTAGL